MFSISFIKFMRVGSRIIDLGIFFFLIKLKHKTELIVLKSV